MSHQRTFSNMKLLLWKKRTFNKRKISFLSYFDSLSCIFSDFLSMWPKTFCVAPTSVNVWTWKQFNAFRIKEKVLKKGENQEVYYFGSVFFFTVPSTSWETDHFLLLTVGVREATHNLCVWIHSVYSVYTHSQIRTFIWMSARSPHLLQTLSLGHITSIHFLLKPRLLYSTNTALKQFRMIYNTILKQTKLKGNHLSSRLSLLFPPHFFFLWTLPLLHLAFAFHFPGCHAGDGGADYGVGESAEREHEHVST